MIIKRVSKKQKIWVSLRASPSFLTTQVNCEDLRIKQKDPPKLTMIENASSKNFKKDQDIKHFLYIVTFLINYTRVDLEQENFT